MKISYMASLNENFKKLGKNIAKYRKEAGLTQVRFAIKLEITREHLSHIEVGIKRPSVELLFSIAENLNIPPYKLMEF